MSVLRIIPEKILYDEMSIEGCAVRKAYRGRGISKARWIMQSDSSLKILKKDKIRLSAAYLINFYQD